MFQPYTLFQLTQPSWPSFFPFSFNIQFKILFLLTIHVLHMFQPYTRPSWSSFFLLRPECLSFKIYFLLHPPTILHRCPTHSIRLLLIFATRSIHQPQFQFRMSFALRTFPSPMFHGIQAYM